MDQLILAVEECDFVNNPVCAPEDVGELFIFEPIFGQVNRTVILMFLAAAIVIAVLYFGLRKPRPIPTKFQAAVESLVSFVRNEIAIGIIGPEGIKYFPYLLSVFTLLLVGNLFEVTPLINFPITSRMALPAFLAILTWVIFVVVGFAKNGIGYFTGVVWPHSVPLGMRPLVGLIEFFSTFLVRPFSLAVRLFANMVAGHVMLSLLLVTGWIFTSNLFINFGEIGLKGLAGPLWFVFGLGIFVFELLVGFIQAYIFTLLSAVYIQTSVHPEH
ncbi:MAG: F0F1 ATP synthase subunit A [Acidimicrobiia bacterium]|nr:F0F1 ATP synthase subunit A [Acidimicrobiia bacterium]